MRRSPTSQAHRDAREVHRTAHDDAALCEHLNVQIVAVRGSERAAKITTESDFALVEALSIFRE